MDVSSRDFAAHPSLFLRRAQAGETIVVTEQGHAIAELRPLARSVESEESALLALANGDLVTAPVRKKSPPVPLVRLAGPSISETVLEDREDRF